MGMSCPGSKNKRGGKNTHLTILDKSRAISLQLMQGCPDEQEQDQRKDLGHAAQPGLHAPANSSFARLEQAAMIRNRTWWPRQVSNLNMKRLSAGFVHSANQQGWSHHHQLEATCSMQPRLMQRMYLPQKSNNFLETQHGFELQQEMCSAGFMCGAWSLMPKRPPSRSHHNFFSHVCQQIFATQPESLLAGYTPPASPLHD